MKRLISIIIIITLFFNIPLQTYANGFDLALAMGMSSSMISGAGALLVGAGLSFASYVAVKKAVEWWYSEQGQTVRDNFRTEIENAVDNVATISNETWTNIRDWVQSKFTSNGTTVLSDIQIYNDIPFTDYSDSEIVPVISENITDAETYELIINGDTYQVISSNVAFSDQQKIYITRNGETISPYYYNTESSPLVNLYFVKNPTGNLRLMFRYYYNGSMSDNLVLDDVYTNLGTTDNVIDYTGSDVLNDNTWDYDVDGTRDLTIPTDLSQLENTTYTNVQAGDYTVTNSVTIVDVYDGLFEPNFTPKSDMSLLQSLLNLLLNLWDLIIEIVKFLGRFVNFMFTAKDIQPNTSKLVNNDVITGIEWARENTTYSGVNIFSLITSVALFVFNIKLVKIVRKNI